MVEFSIKLSWKDYQELALEKVRSSPNIYINTLLPSLVFIFLFVVFNQLEISGVLEKIVLVITGLYAVNSLLMYYFIGHVIAFFHAKKKIEPEYTFKIDSNGITRESNGKSISFKWTDFISVQKTEKYIFLNVKKGTVALPIYKLSDREREEVKGYLA